MRLLELKIFKDKIPVSKLFEFIRQYNIVKGYGNTFVNTLTASDTYREIKKTQSFKAWQCISYKK